MSCLSVWIGLHAQLHCHLMIDYTSSIVSTFGPFFRQVHSGVHIKPLIKFHVLVHTKKKIN